MPSAWPVGSASLVTVPGDRGRASTDRGLADNGRTNPRDVPGPENELLLLLSALLGGLLLRRLLLRRHPDHLLRFFLDSSSRLERVVEAAFGDRKPAPAELPSVPPDLAHATKHAMCHASHRAWFSPRNSLRMQEKIFLDERSDGSRQARKTRDHESYLSISVGLHRSQRS